MPQSQFELRRKLLQLEALYDVGCTAAYASPGTYRFETVAPLAPGEGLTLAVLGLLVLDPWLVRSVGFQLSVTATAGMVALASPLAERFGRFAPGPIAAAAHLMRRIMVAHARERKAQKRGGGHRASGPASCTTSSHPGAG